MTQTIFHSDEAPASTPARVFTLDRVPLGKAEWSDTGLVAPARLGRVGVQVYEDPNTGRRFGVLRPPEEVFAADSLKSFELKPVTNGHPSEFVSVVNARGVTIGAVSGVHRDAQDPNYMAATIAIWDQAALEDFKAGRQELSNGYFAERVPAPEGSVYKDPTTGKEEPYEFIQRRIVGNHVALVDAGRAGPGARVFADSAKGNGEITFQIDTAFTGTDLNSTQPKRKEPMEKIIIDGVTFEVSTQVNQAIAKLNATHAETVKGLNAKIADADTVRGERDSLKVQVADLNAKLTTANDPKTIEARINDRLKIAELAKAHGIEDAISLSLVDVQRQVIAKLAPTVDLKGQSDQYVAGVFASVTATTDGVGKNLGTPVVTADTMPKGGSTRAADYRKEFFAPKK